MTGGLRASRVRKARAESSCGLCGGIIRTGQQIGLVQDRWWAHTVCITTRNAKEENVTTTGPLTAYGRLVRSYDHTPLTRLPAYQALRQALSDMGNQATEAAEEFLLAGFLEAVRDMALTAPYADCCPSCGSRVTEMTWPHAAVRDGSLIRGTYRCRQGHQWTCNYGVDLPAYL